MTDHLYELMECGHEFRFLVEDGSDDYCTICEYKKLLVLQKGKVYRVAVKLRELFLEIEKDHVMRAHASLVLAAREEMTYLELCRDRLAYQDAWLSRGVYFRTQEYLDLFGNFSNKDNPFKSGIDKLKEAMPCGHEARFAVNADDGTGYCVICEWEATREENERIKAFATGRGMVSEADGIEEVAVLVCGLYDKIAELKSELEKGDT